MDKVSIITPAYNASKFIIETIESVQSQTYENWEMIIINDCSTDDTWDKLTQIAKTEPRLKIVNNIENLRVSKTRNKGIDLASGRYLCFLDADDKWLPDKLKVQILFMKQQQVPFSFTGYEFADDNCSPTGKKVTVPSQADYYYLLKRNIIWTCTTMFDLKVIDKQDLYMPEISLGEDVAVWRNVVKKYGPAYGINKILSLYRRSSNTLSSNKWKAVRQAWHNYRKIEQLNLIKTFYYFSCYVLDAIWRRI